MEISLPDGVMEKLPSPDGQGLVRVTVSLKMGDGSKAKIVEINDVPVGGDEYDDEDKEGMPDEASMPSPDDIASQIMR